MRPKLCAASIATARVACAQQLVALAVPEEGGKEEAVEELTGATTEGPGASPKLPPVASPSKLPAMERPGTLP